MDTAKLQTKADAAAKYVAKAEGWGTPGALPTRTNNPGDMKLGNRGWGVVQEKTVYLKADPEADLQDKTDGYSALRREWKAMLSGASHVYHTEWTFLQVALEWTGGDKWADWVKIVCDGLSITVETTLQEYLEA